MMWFLGAWALVSVAFVLGWAMRSAMVAERHPSRVRRAPSRVRRLGLLGLFTTLAGKLMLGGVAVAAVGTLAVDGSLPKPVQDAVSAAGKSVGLEIPSSEDESDLRYASPSASENPLVVRQRILAVMANWEGKKDCDYLRALAQAAGATPLGKCPKEERGEDKADDDRKVAPSNSVTSPPTTTEPTLPPVESPPAEPPPAESPPSEPPPAEPPPSEPPPSEPPPEEPPDEPDPVGPPVEEPDPVGPPTDEPDPVGPPTDEPDPVGPPTDEPPP